MTEDVKKATKKTTTRRASGPKPVYVLYMPEITEEGKMRDLQLTRNPATAMKFLSDNPGAKVEERQVA